MPTDTIFALSSGRPPAAIGVVRVSGPKAGDALRAMTGALPTAKLAKLVSVRDPQTKDTLDQAVALWFPGPASETGEDVAELQLHGGRAVIAAVLGVLGRMDGLRLAEPGEFTRRGFENGKLDLTAVEGLADLIGAETEAQRRQALRQLRGALGGKAEDWRRRLIAAQAQVEAGIDFSDEGDVPEGLLFAARHAAQQLLVEIEETLADARGGERLREGLVVAIAGPPNAGKSTLLNRLARREVAIVSPHAGTTRDVIEVHLDLGGYPVTLLDTAGQRESDDPVEQEGIRRARARAAEADLIMWVTEDEVLPDPVSGEVRPTTDAANDRPGDRGRAVSQPFPGPTRPLAEVAADSPGRHDLSDGEVVGLGSASRTAATAGAASAEVHVVLPSESEGARPDCTGPVWVVRNKIDKLSNNNGMGRNLSPDKRPLLWSEREFNKSESKINFNVSALTGNGMDALIAALARFAETALATESGLITRARHRRMLEDVADHLRRFETADAEELAAEELRLAARALGRLTGRVDVEDVLDVIFRDFCVGK